MRNKSPGTAHPIIVRITEYLDIELTAERWRCNRCGADLADARESYKKGCLIRARDPREVHVPIGPDKAFNFSFDPAWIRIVEFYCPACGVMVENEYLPPGHPLTWDIQLDIDRLKAKHGVTTPRPAPAPRAVGRRTRDGAGR
jgi:acetone carboxylase gamma subunit